MKNIIVNYNIPTVVRVYLVVGFPNGVIFERLGISFKLAVCCGNTLKECGIRTLVPEVGRNTLQNRSHTLQNRLAY